MSYKSIMVCPIDKDMTSHLTRIGCQIAAESGHARVIGAHWINRVHEFQHGERVSGRWTNHFDFPVDQLVHDMSDEFCRITSELDFPCEWVSINAELGRHHDVVVEYARCNDLVIAPAFSDAELQTSYTAQLILKSGRPVLVVPDYNPPRPWNLDTVMLAWNASRESSRAAFAALPLLHQASKVEIFWVEEPDNPDNIVHYLIKEFSAALAFHQIQVVVNKVTRGTGKAHSISQLIADRATDISAGLVVAGAYGETGASLAALGSVSTRLLAASQVPVLFST